MLHHWRLSYEASEIPQLTLSQRSMSCCISTCSHAHGLPDDLDALLPSPVATHGEIGPFHYHITLELVAVEELPPLWASENIRLQMAQKFKLEGNDIFATGDFSR